MLEGGHPRRKKSTRPILGTPAGGVVDTSWMIVDDALTGKIALLCNYIAAGSPAAEDSDALIVPSETALRLSRAITSCFLFKLEYIPANSAESFFKIRF